MNSGAAVYFDQGARAWKLGATRASCPYILGLGAAAEWLAGWDNEEALDAAERAQYREEYARDLEPYTRAHREGDVAT